MSRTTHPTIHLTLSHLTNAGAPVPTRDEAWPNGTPCWIDLMVTDPAAAARQFYSGLFGWDIQDGPPEAGGYLMCMINGRAVTAISPKPQENPFPNVWSTYLASDDLDAAAARAKAAGSPFMMEPMDVMTAGRLAFAMYPTKGAVRHLAGRRPQRGRGLQRAGRHAFRPDGSHRRRPGRGLLADPGPSTI